MLFIQQVYCWLVGILTQITFRVKTLEIRAFCWCLLGGQPTASQTHEILIFVFEKMLTFAVTSLNSIVLIFRSIENIIVILVSLQKNTKQWGDVLILSFAHCISTTHVAEDRRLTTRAISTIVCSGGTVFFGTLLKTNIALNHNCLRLGHPNSLCFYAAAKDLFLSDKQILLAAEGGQSRTTNWSYNRGSHITWTTVQCTCRHSMLS